jgi:tRNA G37 N-methylase Trm5
VLAKTKNVLSNGFEAKVFFIFGDIRKMVSSIVENDGLIRARKIIDLVVPMIHQTGDAINKN